MATPSQPTTFRTASGGTITKVSSFEQLPSEVYAGRDARRALIGPDRMEQLRGMETTLGKPGWAEDQIDRDVGATWLSNRLGRPKDEVAANLETYARGYFGKAMTAGMLYDTIAEHEQMTLLAAQAAFQPQTATTTPTTGQTPASGQGTGTDGATDAQEVPTPKSWQWMRTATASFERSAQNIPGGFYGLLAGYYETIGGSPEKVDLSKDQAWVSQYSQLLDMEERGMGNTEAAASLREATASRARIADAEFLAARQEWENSTIRGALATEARKKADFWYELGGEAANRWDVDPEYRDTLMGQFAEIAGSLPATSALIAVGGIAGIGPAVSAAGLTSVGTMTFADVEQSQMAYQGEAYDAGGMDWVLNVANAGGQTVLERLLPFDDVLRTALKESARLGGKVAVGQVLKELPKRMLIAGLGEGMEEAVQGAWDDAIVAAGYDDTRFTLDEEFAHRRIFEFLAGFAGGGMMAGVVHPLASRDRHVAARKAEKAFAGKDGGLLGPQDFALLRRARTDAEILAMPEGELVLAGANGDTVAQETYNRKLAKESFVQTEGMEFEGYSVGTSLDAPAITKPDGTVVRFNQGDAQEMAAFNAIRTGIVTAQATGETLEAFQERFGDRLTVARIDPIKMQQLVDEGVIPAGMVDAYLRTAVEVNGISREVALETAAIMGMADIQQNAQGVFDMIAKVARSADPTIAIEEVAEGWVKAEMMNQKLDPAELTAIRQRWHESRGESDPGAGKEGAELNVVNVEWFSKRAIDYALATRKDTLPGGWGKWLRSLGERLKKILRGAAQMRKLMRKGELDPRLEELLRQSLGFEKITDAEIAAYERQRVAEEEMTQDEEEGRVEMELAPLREREEALRETGQFEGNELLDAVKLQGGLKAPSGEEVFSGELRTLWENLPTGQRLRVFRKDGAELDRLRQNLAEEGFQFETVNDLLNALDRSTRGDPVYPTFSIVYREASAYQALELLDPASSSDTMAKEYFVATTRELATGQGDNKGVLIELDGSRLNLGRARTQKPGAALSVATGGGEERVALGNQQQAYQDAVKAFEFTSDAVKQTFGRRLLTLTKQLVAEGWTKTERGGVTRVERSVSQPTTFSIMDDMIAPRGTVYMRDLPRDIREDLFNMHAVGVNPEAREGQFQWKRGKTGMLKLDGMRVENIPPNQLKAYVDADPRKLPPLVIADGKLIDGQHRIQAARVLGINELPAVDVTKIIDTAQTGFISELPDGAWRGGPIEPTTFSIAQTETPEFKAWFGESVVTDNGKPMSEGGKPLVVYHGTRGEFTVFDYSRIGQQGRSEGAGFYFTNSKDVASGYGAPMGVFLSMKKPLAYDAKPFSKPVVGKIVHRVAELEAQVTGGDIADGFLSNFGDVRSEGLLSVVRQAGAMIAADETALDQLSGIVGSGVNPEFVNRAIRDVTGFDGVVAKGFSNAGDGSNSIYVAFFPTQIKSATDNTGTFDPTNPDITMSIAGPVQTPTQSPTLAAYDELLDDIHAKRMAELGFKELVRMRNETYVQSIRASRKKYQRGLPDEVERLATPTDEYIRRLSVGSYRAMMKMVSNASQATASDHMQLNALAAKWEELDEGTLFILDEALLNGDVATINALANRYGFAAEYQAVTDAMIARRRQALEVGISPSTFWNAPEGFNFNSPEWQAIKSAPDGETMEAGLEAAGWTLRIPNYWPRTVIDHDAYVAHLTKTDPEASILARTYELALRKAKARGTHLSQAEMDALVQEANKQLRTGGQGKGSKPGALKQRTIQQVDPEAVAFYQKPIDSAYTHFERLNDYIEMLRLFGKASVMEEAAVEGAITPVNLDKSIGAYVTQQIAAGELTRMDEQKLSDAISDYFNYKPSPNWVNNIKSVGYLSGLTQAYSTFTAALPDFFWSAYEAEANPLGLSQAVLEKFRGKSRLTLNDLGISETRISEEFRTQTDQLPGRMVNVAFKVIRLTWFSNTARQTLVNTSVNTLIKSARSGRFNRSQRRRIEALFNAEEEAQLIEDARNGEMTEFVRLYAYATVAGYNPVTRLQSSPAYNANPRGRLFYQYKSWLKVSIAATRREAIDDMLSGDPTRALKGTMTLGYIMILMLMFSLPADMIRALMTGKSFYLTDEVVNRMLGMIGLNHYVARNLGEDPVKAGMAFLAPAVGGIAKDMFTDASTLWNYPWGEADFAWGKLRTWNNVPFGGRIWQGWFGSDKEKNAQERQEKAFIEFSKISDEEEEKAAESRRRSLLRKYGKE